MSLYLHLLLSLPLLAKGPAPRAVPGPPAIMAPKAALQEVTPRLAVVRPAAGSTLAMDGSRLSVDLTVAGFPARERGESFLMVELLQGTAVLGSALPPVPPITLNTAATTVSVSVIPGQYFAGGSARAASPGSGYSYRVTAFRGTWAGSHTVLAQAASGSFSLSVTGLRVQEARPGLDARVATLAAPALKVVGPRAGVAIPLDGQTITSDYMVSGFSPADAGQVRVMLELLQDGKPLGVLVTPNVPLTLNTTAPLDSVGFRAGQYIALPGFESREAKPGGGYQVRVTAYKGDWRGTPVILARGQSGVFSFAAELARPFSRGTGSTVTGPPVIVVTDPAAGKAFPLDAATLSVAYRPTNFHPHDQGSVKVMVELLQNGKLLGVAANPAVPLSMNITAPIDSVGVTAGQYTVTAPPWQFIIAPPGDGYQYRVSAYTGDWLKAPVILASGLSGTFSFGPRKVVSGPPALAITEPRAGSVPLDGKLFYVMYTYGNLDPYQAAGYHVIAELLRNGTVLGPTLSPSVPFGLNYYQTQSSIGAPAGQYIELPGFITRTAPAGSGYRVRVTIYQGTWQSSPAILAQALSDSFSFE